MKNKIRTILLTTVIVSFTVVIFFFAYLINLFYIPEPSDERFVFLFEEYTNTRLPKTGIVQETEFISGINDGIEAAIIKINNDTEFNKLYAEIGSKNFIIKKLRKKGIGYFHTKLASEKIVLIDTIFYSKEGFKFCFIKNENIIIFEKDW